MKIKKVMKKLLPEKVKNKIILYKNNKRSKISYEKMKNEVKKQYMEHYNKELNWENPQTYSEKISVSKIYRR